MIKQTSMQTGCDMGQIKAVCSASIGSARMVLSAGVGL